MARQMALVAVFVACTLCMAYASNDVEAADSHHTFSDAELDSMFGPAGVDPLAARRAEDETVNRWSLFTSGPIFDDFGSGAFGSGGPGLCRESIPGLVYFKTHETVYSDHCVPKYHGERRCSSSDSHDVILLGQKYWSVGGPSNNFDKQSCGPLSHDRYEEVKHMGSGPSA